MIKEMSIALQMGIAAQAMGKRIREEFTARNMTIIPQQFGLLNFIAKDKDIIQTELATLMDKDKSAVLREIDALEEKGLVSRVNDAADRRKKFVNITPEGKKVLKQGRLLLDKLMNEMLEGLPQEDKEAFMRVLQHMENKAKEA